VKQQKIFLAGAAGAIGLPLAQLLVKQGYTVTGTTRQKQRVSQLTDIGVKPVLVDIYDRRSLKLLLKTESPDIVIHQLTDLPLGVPAEKMEEGRIRNNQIRLEGTRNLLDAMDNLKIGRLIVQSIAFQYNAGHLPHAESDKLSSEALEQFETMVLESGFKTTVLRYGRFYGGRTGVERMQEPCRVNVISAAHATILALGKLKKPVYNVCEDSEYADNRAFIQETGWKPEADQ